MSFDTLKRDELISAAEKFGVDFKPDSTRGQLIEALLEDHITWDFYKSSLGVEEEAEQEALIPEEKVPTTQAAKLEKKNVLLKMDGRDNPRFEIRGYTFSAVHPFVAVTETDANFILSNLDGFRMAMPKEVEEYYE